MKFKVGEIAITTRVRRASGAPAGSEVEIICVGPFQPGEIAMGKPFLSISDYLVRHTDGQECACAESYLRKRPQPGIPEAILRIFEVEAKQERPA